MVINTWFLLRTVSWEGNFICLEISLISPRASISDRNLQNSPLHFLQHPQQIYILGNFDLLTYACSRWYFWAFLAQLGLSLSKAALNEYFGAKLRELTLKWVFWSPFVGTENPWKSQQNLRILWKVPWFTFLGLKWLKILKLVHLWLFTGISGSN